MDQKQQGYILRALPMPLVRVWLCLLAAPCRSLDMFFSKPCLKPPPMLFCGAYKKVYWLVEFKHRVTVILARVHPYISNHIKELQLYRTRCEVFVQMEAWIAEMQLKSQITLIVGRFTGDVPQGCYFLCHKKMYKSPWCAIKLSCLSYLDSQDMFTVYIKSRQMTLLAKKQRWQKIYQVARCILQKTKIPEENICLK